MCGGRTVARCVCATFELSRRLWRGGSATRRVLNSSYNHASVRVWAQVHKFVSRNFIRAVSAVGALPATTTGLLTASGRAPTSHTATGDNYSVGTEVEVSYDRGKSWKHGHVAHVHSNGTLDIVHDDAATDIERGVPMEFVRPRGRGHTRGGGGVAMNGARRRSAGATHLRPVGAKVPILGDPVEVDDKVRIPTLPYP